MSGDEKRLLVDASVFITLAEIGSVELIGRLDGQVEMPNAVAEEITDEPAASALPLPEGVEHVENMNTWFAVYDFKDSLETDDEFKSSAEKAASYLGLENPQENWHGDVALLAHALWLERYGETVVLITDDKPLRKTCKALSIPISGSIGVLVRAVERGELTADEAKENLYAMDEVGARLSASLVRRAERLIDDAARTD